MNTSRSLKKTLTRGAVRIGFGVLSRYRRLTNDLPDDPERPWLAEYTVFDIQETLEPYPDVPLHDFLVESGDENSEEGLIQRGTTVTYPEVLADAERLATALVDRGIQKGDRVATIGIPDPDRPGSERVKIFIEPVPGADFDADAVRDHLDGRVPRQAMPKEFELVDEIPLTDVGKINKQALRDDEADA